MVKTILTLVAFCSCLSSCSPGPETNAVAAGAGPGIGVSATPAAAAPGADAAHRIEKAVSAKDGGVISMVTAQHARIQIVFPSESLAGDVVLEATPWLKAPVADPAVVINGFALQEKGTGKGPSLKSPALVYLTVKGAVAPDVTIVRYHDDGKGYDVVPTKISSKGGVSTLRAAVRHFSSYGAMKVPGAARAKSEAEEMKDFDWVIYIKDKYSLVNGPMKTTVFVDMKAVNRSGDIEGPYAATATSRTTNEMNAGGGSVSAPATTSIPPFSFDLGTFFAPLVKTDVEPVSLVPGDFEPVPLVPDQPDFTATGRVNLSSSGVGTVSAGGATASGSFGDSATVPFTLNVNGPRAELILDVPQIGQMLFKGFMRGEGKK